jgi:hypothetical protein
MAAEWPQRRGGGEPLVTGRLKRQVATSSTASESQEPAGLMPPKK